MYAKCSIAFIALIAVTCIHGFPTEVFLEITNTRRDLNLRCPPGWSSLSPNGRCYKRVQGGLRACHSQDAQSFSLEQSTVDKTRQEFEFVEDYIERLCYIDLDCRNITMAYSKAPGARALATKSYRKALHSTKLFSDRYGLTFPIEKSFACLQFTVCCPFQRDAFANMRLLKACPGDYGIPDDRDAICVKRELPRLPKTTAMLHYKSHQSGLGSEEHSINAIIKQNRHGLLFILIGIPVVSLVSLALCFAFVVIRAKRVEEQILHDPKMISRSLSAYAASLDTDDLDRVSTRLSQRARPKWTLYDSGESSSLMTDFIA